ncbi:hypothetical protein Y049_1368 [Burkholderia pseudomallei MSHR684]|nr:hypothetical protein Y049_1368 [Burkholderia pseudomallei MSHR684]
MLMFGIIEGCTQPASISTRRSRRALGHASRRARGGTLSRSRFGNSGRTCWPSRITGANTAAFGTKLASRRRTIRCDSGRDTFVSTTLRPMSTSRPYSTPDGQVVSQLRHVRQRSRCCCVLRVTSAPSSICLIR